MPLRKYQTVEEAKEARRQQLADYWQTYTMTDEQKARYKAKAKERYANDPDYRAAKIAAVKARRAKAREAA